MSPAASAKQTRKNLAESRLNNHRLMSMSGMEGMPAVFPYEGKSNIDRILDLMETVFRLGHDH